MVGWLENRAWKGGQGMVNLCRGGEGRWVSEWTVFGFLLLVFLLLRLEVELRLPLREGFWFFLRVIVSFLFRFVFVFVFGFGMNRIESSFLLLGKEGEGKERGKKKEGSQVGTESYFTIMIISVRSRV
ncbi:hypothetical protein BKA65DRAFT_509852 [Rhexocercosporidium sp. MPI-PUGE-AT-0058]|nr:hypothetical protein BKA65DRAFT_509852 [Rhexocercosporidium sp. MPI-PUGE-AT-0058]